MAPASSTKQLQSSEQTGEVSGATEIIWLFAVLSL